MKKGSDDSHFDQDFIQFIRENPAVPDIPALSKNEIPPWIRLCQHFDTHLDKKIQSKSTALLFLKEKLLNNDPQINNLKELKKYLTALTSLGIKDLTLQVNLSNKPIPTSWEDEVKKNKFSIFHQITAQENPSIRVKPHQLHWRIWRHIFVVIALVDYYKLYINNSKSKG